MMKVLCFIATSVFALFCYWQFNDLQQYGTQLWYFWVIGYGGVALTSLYSAWRPLPTALYLSGSAVALAGALMRFGDIQWDQTVFYNETNPAGNETGGLAIVALWLLFLGWKMGRRNHASTGK